MFDDPLSLPIRGAITVSVLVFVLQAARAIGRPRGAATKVLFGYGLVAVLASAALSHVDGARPLLMRIFPLGAAAGTALALGSIASPEIRARFAFDDAQARSLLAWRAVFGGLLLAMAGTGHMPVSFAISAGLGDLSVGWLAQVAPRGSLGPTGSRSWRLLVHGAGLVDVLVVMAEAVLVVRPWSVAHGNATTSMTLPWVFVPFMFAMNLHGVVQALSPAFREATAAEPGGDGSESAGRVRRALP